MQSTVPGVNQPWEAHLTAKISQASRAIPRPWQWRLFTLSLVASDLLLTGIAFRLAYLLRFEASISLFRLEVAPSFYFYQHLAFILIPIWLVIFAATGLYNRQNLLGGPQEYSLVFYATTIGMLLVIAVGFLLPEFIFARSWLLMAWLLAFLFTAMGRFLIRRVIHYLREYGYYLSPAVIVGANDEGLSLAEQLMSWRSSGIHLLGFMDKKLPPGKKVFKHLYCLGTVEELDSVVNQYKVEEIILATSAFSSRDNLMEIFKRYGMASGVNLRMSSGLYEIISTGMGVKDFAYVRLVDINPMRLAGANRVMKLILDYSLTLVMLPLISPLLLLIAIAIKLDSPGPVIQRRRVMGVNGKQFDAFKFRTMYVNGNEILAAHPKIQEELAENHKPKEDLRITRVGKWLRKYSLDELPQLFNILIAEMAWVGPRMISPAEMDKFDRWDINLLTVRPGITGLWKVSGRLDISYDERVRLDMYYIRNWSIWQDLHILFQTIPTVINGRGAC